MVCDVELFTVTKNRLFAFQNIKIFIIINYQSKESIKTVPPPILQRSDMPFKYYKASKLLYYWQRMLNCNVLDCYQSSASTVNAKVDNFICLTRYPVLD